MTLRAGERALGRDDTLGEHLLDAAEGLAGAFFVFDEGEADVLVAVLAEAYPRRHGHLGFVEQELRELERA